MRLYRLNKTDLQGATTSKANCHYHWNKYVVNVRKCYGKDMKKLVADSQYSSKKFRKKAADCGVKAVIPYPTNQCSKEKGLLRVDKHFRTHGPACERRIYKQRASTERTNSRLKEQLSLNKHKVRGLGNIVIHVLLCIIIMLLVAVAALRLNKPGKSKTIAQLG